MPRNAASTFDPLVVGLGLVLALTAYRLALLPAATADLFVDETQYWQWGQALDWGYYSKPPLIGWVIRAVTELAGSDSAFWIRAPGAVFHAATALLIIGAASEIAPRGAAVWAGLAYLCLPFVSVGAALISTDTILLPFYASALWLWLRLTRAPSAMQAGLLGLCLGLGFLAKYAAIYFGLCATLAALTIPQARIAWRDLALALAVFALVISPNVIWNLQNDLVTLSHTADNVNWLGEALQLRPDRAWEFFGSQFFVMGPLLFAAFLWAVWQALRGTDWRAKFLVVLSLPILLLVVGQAFLSRAYANWAVTAYVAGIILTVLIFYDRARLLLVVAMVLNLALAFALPLVLTDAERWQAVDGERLLLRRYVGRADTSAWILSMANREGVAAIVSGHRDLLADLFYAARDSEIQIFAVPTSGPPEHFYAQRYPLPATFTGPVLYADFNLPGCDSTAQDSSAAAPAYRGASVEAAVMEAWCWARP
ncbi:MAG: glycosyltransferase family 39 protein [Pseudomonadota bacterium]